MQSTMKRKQIKGIVHNSSDPRKHREENLASLFGENQGTDMDMYDFEFGKNGVLKVIHKNADED